LPLPKKRLQSSEFRWLLSPILKTWMPGPQPGGGEGEGAGTGVAELAMASFSKAGGRLTEDALLLNVTMCSILSIRRFNRMKRKKMAAASSEMPSMTPMAMPAFAPPLNPLEELVEDIPLPLDVDEAAAAESVEVAVCVAPLWLDVDAVVSLGEAPVWVAAKAYVTGTPWALVMVKPAPVIKSVLFSAFPSMKLQ
jgi:hypothetical protein